MPLIKLPLDFNPDAKAHIAGLHQALTALNLIEKPAKGGQGTGKMDVNLKGAIKAFKENNRVGKGDALNQKTIEAINVALHDNFITSNKGRVSQVHKMLEKLELNIDKNETGKRVAGATTRAAIEKFQKANNLEVNGKVSEELLIKLSDTFIQKKFAVRTQIGKLQKDLLTVRRIAKIETRIDEAELKNKEIGATTTALITKFQEKYKLNASGKLDKATMDKIQSVAASKGIAVSLLKKVNAQEVKTIGKSLRLNKVHKEVANAQQSLVQLGFTIDEKEHKTNTFGKTTKEAVIAFQKKRGLELSGHIDGKTRKAINKAIIQINPEADAGLKFRIRGSVRDELWTRTSNMVLKIFEKLVDGKSKEPLMTKKNMTNGFFDITYTPPKDPKSGQVKKEINLSIELYSAVDSNPAHDAFVESKIINNVSRIQWVNFTLGEDKYKGDSDYTISMALINKYIASEPFLTISEKEDNKQVSQLSIQTGLSTDDIMRLFLSHKISAKLNNTMLTPEVFYAFLRQNLPADLPSDLFFPISKSWDTAPVLIENAESGIGFLDSEIQVAVLDTAIKENLVSRFVFRDKNKIITALDGLKVNFSLSKPILVGNGNIQSLINLSSVQPQHSPLIAKSFIDNKGFNQAFWKSLEDDPAIPNVQVEDLKMTVDLGGITKNFEPILKAFKTDIKGGKFKAVSDLAKLSMTELENYIKANNNQVPANLKGTVSENITAYASTLKLRSENLYPSIAFAASIKRSASNPFDQIGEVEKFFDSNPTFKYKEQTVDDFLVQNEIELEKPILSAIKSVVRIQKIAGSADTGVKLVENKLHSSMQVYFTGKDNLKAKGFDEKTAHQVFENAKSQYSQILGNLLQLKPELNLGTPAAISKQTYTKEEIKAWFGEVPDLETLFGNMDYCECEHCKSLYGPSAYFTDMLRFLKTHPSLLPGKTVKDILFERRPDLGKIKLNCENTNTPIPYVDLVCEILENNIKPLAPNPGFDFQTTLTQKELRAMPQNIRKEAYDTLAVANYPMDSSFNMVQEEARINLRFLNIPRYELMEKFRDISNVNNKIPADVNIAAEYFGISIHEKSIICNNAQANKADQEVYWGFDAVKDTIWQDALNLNKAVSVHNFMKRSQLSYNEVLELLMVKFVNADNGTRSVIVRPPDTCSTDVQFVNNLTFSKLDLMHRFIRLWRKTGWKMWELDLLLRNPQVGGNSISDTSLSRLKIFKDLQDKLGLSAESLLTFYGEINTEERIEADKPSVKIPSLYHALFQNPTISKPIDVKFSLPLDNTLVLGINAAHANYTPEPTILSALSIRQEDLDKLAPKTDGHLSLATLSTLYRYVYLAKTLRLSVADLLTLMRVCTDNPFLLPANTLAFFENHEAIKRSTLSINELDYVLNFIPSSPIGWRDEVYNQQLGNLKNIIGTNKDVMSKLQLNAAEQALILNFDANGLSGMTDNQIMTSIAPLVNLLKAKQQGLDDTKLSIEQRIFITNFNDAFPIQADRKLKLIANITVLQSDLKNLIAQSSLQIQSLLANAFLIPNNQVAILMKLKMPQANTKSLLEILSDEIILTNNPDLGAQKSVLLLLHKISLVIKKMNLDEKHLQWFIDHAATVNTLNFATLPLAVAPGNQYNAWLNLWKFIEFKNGYPEPDNASLLTILNTAINGASVKATIFAEINKITQWDTASSTNLEDLDTKLNLTKASYLEATTYKRLNECFAMLKISGVDANTMFGWNDLQNNQVSTQSRLAIKSKFENDDWLAKITPFQDELREKKRKALVAYFIEFSLRTTAKLVMVNGKLIPNPQYWEDSNALFKYFLIDVEMSPCQLTSRIKQAISSVQFFVQRCFLNFENRYVKVSQDEKDDKSSPNAWSQWKWMKNYRIWEVNRKIFFYPENWIVPELRDDKSPFFEELENDILQNEITHDNVESAYLNYLHKVDEVAHLDVCGVYHEQDDMNPAETGYEVSLLHVIGRTKAAPHLYYYRKYDLNYSSWTAWQKIDLDIAGDHLVPVVYNRKLHIFWLVANEKPIKLKKMPAAKPTAGDSKTQDAQEPAKYWEIQLAWSVLKHTGWSPKKISKDKLIHPWERPLFSYQLKPYYFSKLNQLYLDVYISTSEKFNNGLFYNQATGGKHRLTKNYFDERYLPWHSSAFVFDGDIQSIKLKALNSYFDINFFGVNISLPTGLNSWHLVHNGFGEEGRKIELLQPKEFGPRIKLPTGMHFTNNRLSNNRFQAINNAQLNVLNNGQNTTLANGARHPFEVVATQQDMQFDSAAHPLFYQDTERAFFIRPESIPIFNSYQQQVGFIRQFRFMPFYHPYTSLFIRELNRSGLDGLLKRNIQLVPQNYAPFNNFNFSSYAPTSNAVVDATAKRDIVDFSFGGAYSIYNWELFFHAPLMIADRLFQNQRFEEAMRWFHYIFDPTNIEPLPSPQRYWVTKPFFEYNADDYRKQRIEEILKNIGSNKEQLKAWRNNPFKPHVIARHRPVAYQKAVVMKYIDNLIAWGDMLFRRDTIESINEASMLYMLAYEILGDRPIKVPKVNHEDKSFNEIESKLDEFGNARVDVLLEDTALPIKVSASSDGDEPMPKLETFYFCIPNNDLILKYWDTVEDRLFKIRHCMNIEGVVRQLPLFEPPIDPALLVKAAAAGIDLNSVLNDIASGTPYYRFRTMVQKSIEFCNEVKMLGERLLSVIEKKDAEELSLLRSDHEIKMQKALTDIRKKQIDEAVEAIGGLNKVFDMATEKENYYKNNADDGLNAWEITSLALNSASTTIDTAVSIGYIWAGVLTAIPKFIIGASGFGGTPHGTAGTGGDQFGTAVKFAVEGLSKISQTLDKMASISNTVSSYERRSAEWRFQQKLAGIEKEQIQFQISAAEIRQAIAEKELENNELRIEQVMAEDEYMRNKYSNVQLYSWMLSQVSSLYFMSYQLAYNMAKKAEKCYQHELGDTSTNFIQPVYWDSLKKGLLSGDKLMYDLHRMEAAYIDNNKRELEITKHISLANMFPLQFMQLKQTGKCTLSLPEWLFNMDYPGHYFRRLKNVGISIPCIVGPYTSVNCTLSLLKSTIRLDATGGSYAPVNPDDSRFRTKYGAITSIATSHAQNDSGMFELSFNDERYLPFEGSGAESEWLIELPKESNYFDFESLADVVMHLNYSARNGGEALAIKARADLSTKLPDNITRLFSLKHEFPNEWHKFMHPVNGQLPEMIFTVKAENYPFFARTKINTIQLKKAHLWIESSNNINVDFKITSGSAMPNIAVNKDVNYNNVPYASPSIGSVNPTGEVRIKINTANVLATIDNIYIMVQSS